MIGMGLRARRRPLGPGIAGNRGIPACKNRPSGLFTMFAEVASVSPTGRCEPRRAYLALARGEQLERGPRQRPPRAAGLFHVYAQDFELTSPERRLAAYRIGDFRTPLPSPHGQARPPRVASWFLRRGRTSGRDRRARARALRRAGLRPAPDRSQRTRR